MTRNEFYTIVKEEGLNKYNIGDSQSVAVAANVMGCVNNGKWIVYETDERAACNILNECDSESEGLQLLLNELRSKKRKEEIMKKLKGK